MTDHSRAITLTVNDEAVRETVDARTWSISCATSSASPAAMWAASRTYAAPARCGLDGVTVRGCLTLAVQCAGRRVETIEGASDAGEIADLEQAFARRDSRASFGQLLPLHRISGDRRCRGGGGGGAGRGDQAKRFFTSPCRGEVGRHRVRPSAGPMTGSAAGRG